VPSRRIAAFSCSNALFMGLGAGAAAERRSGVALLTPAYPHCGRAEAGRVERKRILEAVYTGRPERFIKSRPQPPKLPTAAWINKPEEVEALQLADISRLAQLDRLRSCAPGSSEGWPPEKYGRKCPRGLFVEEAREIVLGEGDVPSPLYPPPGCSSHPRCSMAISDCSHLALPLRELASGHFVACIRA